ncbi:M16 family metallopeptidase [Haloimpatiens sp. FM7330]|uniref:M16 family metallopeptidase n=1 Tax=Haloimpatiens sp. FM7330 TaxID=3298610 RepID=UPI00362D7CF5
MKEITMDNGIKIVYEQRSGELTSFSIAFDAGAVVEEKNENGLAHVVEHMIFKGTKTKKEEEINKLCDEYFGFNNAMTNYPYVVYYGTCLSQDFDKAFGLYSDIILNPTFPNEGFKEEIDVICQELREWKDDTAQYCEDELFYNSFNERRIKNLIIGTEESVRSFSRYNVIEFYRKHYIPKNCVISIVSSLQWDEVYNMISGYYKNWEAVYNENDMKQKYDDINKIKKTTLYEKNNPGTFVKLKKDIETAKIQYIFPIHDLSEKEIKALRVFNSYFGEGTSSLLYDIVRTKNGLAYDITSTIKNENGIKLFTIYVGTSKDKIPYTIRLIDSQIENVKNNTNIFNKEKVSKLVKSIKLKRALGLEQSIRLSLNLAVYGIMFEKPKALFEQLENLEQINENDILRVIEKVLKNPSVQVIEPV